MPCVAEQTAQVFLLRLQVDYNYWTLTMSISAQQKMSETGAMATAMRVVQELPRSRASSPLRITQAPTDLDRQDFFDEDDRMRQCFKSAIGKQLGIRNHYTKVSVLIIHWASEFDTDLGCQSEVRLSWRRSIHACL